MYTTFTKNVDAWWPKKNDHKADSIVVATCYVDSLQTNINPIIHDPITIDPNIIDPVIIGGSLTTTAPLTTSAPVSTSTPTSKPLTCCRSCRSVYNQCINNYCLPGATSCQAACVQQYVNCNCRCKKLWWEALTTDYVCCCSHWSLRLTSQPIPSVPVASMWMFAVSAVMHRDSDPVGIFELHQSRRVMDIDCIIEKDGMLRMLKSIRNGVELDGWKEQVHIVEVCPNTHQFRINRVAETEPTDCRLHSLCSVSVSMAWHKRMMWAILE